MDSRLGQGTQSGSPARCRAEAPQSEVDRWRGAFGRVPFDPAVAPRLLSCYRRLVAPAARRVARLDLLTGREHDVLRLMARGAANAEIAASLQMAGATVKTYIGSIFAKLGVRDRAAAIVFAYDHGVVTPGAAPP
jgi:DNA-binding NarL/FixJ family response regulator